MGKPYDYEKPTDEEYKYLMKYMKPQICDENASCVPRDFMGRKIETCVCNDGFIGDGCSCHNAERCEDYCKKKMPGSHCESDATGNWVCLCDLTTQQPMSYPDGTPCCVDRPQCKSHDDCISQMGDGGYCMRNNQCVCKEPLVMNKKKQCVKPGYEEDDDIITHPCYGVRCRQNAHCEVDKNREPICVCNDGFEGKEGINCLPIEEDRKCKYGSCISAEELMNEQMTEKPNFMVKPGQMCGYDKMNLMCMKDGCCECAPNWNDANGKHKDGCEERDSPCDGKTICSPFADCIDDFVIIFDDELDAEVIPPKGRMDAISAIPIDEKPIEIPDLGYKCRCKKGYIGNGIGPQGCRKPDLEQINECMSIRNPCGRNSICTDLPVGYDCQCDKGFRSLTGDGKNCVKPLDPIDPDRPCAGFCPWSKIMPECYLKDITALHTKLTDFNIMGGDANEAALPGVSMTVATKKRGNNLNRSPYSAFLEFDQVKCGNVLLGPMMSGDVKIAISDRAGVDGTKSIYKVDGVQGFLTKTVSNDRSWSGAVVQFTKTHKYLSDLTGNSADFEMNQFIKETANGPMVKPDYDTFVLSIIGKDVTPDAMGSKFKTCFNVRDGAPFDFVLWAEKEEKQPEVGTVIHKPLDGDHTKCYLKQRIAGKNIKDIVCDEPLVVDGEKVKDKPTFLEMVEQADKEFVACSETKEE